MKAIYHAMNMFNLDVTQRCLIAECWCPVKDIPEVQAALLEELLVTFYCPPITSYCLCRREAELPFPHFLTNVYL